MFRIFSVLLILGICASLLCSGGGCVSAQTGNQNLTSDRIAHITKGVTTQAEVEKMLGAPDNQTLLGDGRRMLIYTGMQSHDNESGIVVSMIPFVGLVAPSQTEKSMRRQQLQIMVNKEGVVEDYDYSDNTSTVNTSSTVLGGHVTETTTPNGAK